MVLPPVFAAGLCRPAPRGELTVTLSGIRGELVMMSVTPAGGQRTRAVPPVTAPIPSRAHASGLARAAVAVLSRMWRTGSVSLLLGAAALVWLIATLLSTTASTQPAVAVSPTTTAAVQTVANIRLVPADVAGSPGGSSGGD